MKTLTLITGLLTSFVNFSRDDVFEKYWEWFEQWNILGSVFRKIGFEICRLMSKVLDVLFTSFTDLFKIISFSNETDAQNFILQYRPIVLAIGGLAIVVCAILMIFGSEEIKGSKLFQNIIAGILIILMMPNVLNMLNTALINYAKAEVGLMEESTGSTLLEYTVDLKYVFADTSYSQKDGDQPRQNTNAFDQDTIWRIDPTEVIIGRTNPGYDDLFKYEYHPEDKSSTKIEEWGPDTWHVDSLTEWYFRYHFKFIPVFVFYVGEILMLALTIAKAIKLILEIMVGNFITNLLALTDIGKGERLKQSVRHLINAYITLAYVFTMVVIYRMFMNFVINSTISDVSKVIFTLFGTLFFIDGPNIIERVFGYDAGLQSVFHTFMAAGKLAKGAAHLAGNAVTAPYRAANALGRLSKRIEDMKGHLPSGKNPKGNSGNSGTNGSSGPGRSSGENGSSRSGSGNNTGKNSKGNSGNSGTNGSSGPGRSSSGSNSSNQQNNAGRRQSPYNQNQGSENGPGSSGGTASKPNNRGTQGSSGTSSKNNYGGTSGSPAETGGAATSPSGSGTNTGSFADSDNSRSDSYNDLGAFSSSDSGSDTGFTTQNTSGDTGERFNDNFNGGSDMNEGQTSTGFSTSRSDHAGSQENGRASNSEGGRVETNTNNSNAPVSQKGTSNPPSRNASSTKPEHNETRPTEKQRSGENNSNETSAETAQRPKTSPQPQTAPSVTWKENTSISDIKSNSKLSSAPPVSLQEAANPGTTSIKSPFEVESKPSKTKESQEKSDPDPEPSTRIQDKR